MPESGSSGGTDGGPDYGWLYGGKGDGSGDPGGTGGPAEADDATRPVRRPDRTAPPPEGAASHAELEGFFAQLADTLEQIDFHKGRTPETAMRKFRRLYLRAGLDEREVRLLRGMLADAQRMAMLANRAR